MRTLGLFFFTLGLLAACGDRSQAPEDLGVDLSPDRGVRDAGVDRGPQKTLELRVDGRFEDWGQTPPTVTDPRGDATGGFDISRVYLASRGTELFIRFDIGAQERNLNAGQSAGELELEVGIPEDRRLVISFRARKAVLKANGGSIKADWLDLRYRAAPTYAAKEFELGLDLATLGVKQGERVTVAFSGSDTVPATSLELTPPPLAVPRRSLNRPPGTLFRVASQNTLFDGLLTADRGASFGRLFRAAAADIYCLQELWQSSAADVARAMETFDPHDDGLPWAVHRGSDYGDTMIASRWPLTPITSSKLSGAVTVAGIALPDGGRLVVASMRPKCCGYIGSSEDQRRIEQVGSLARLLVDLRAGKLGSAAMPFRDAPMVVAGDWNLVGSRTPLTLLEDDQNGPGLNLLWLPKVVGNDFWTWSDRGSSYSPGLLDMMVFSEDTLRSLGGVVFDSGQLEASELAPLGLQVQDSLASDHLLLVADFAKSAP